MGELRSPVIAVCGKGGVGKTAISALLSRALLADGVRPLLLVDADPVGGLTAAVGLHDVPSLGTVREALIAAARGADQREKERLARDLDYMVLEALVERDHFSLLAMGHSTERGCYCSVNTLLRDAIDLILAPFAAAVLDAEAGIEQINRRVTRRVSHALVVTDGSSRSVATLHLIRKLLPKVALFAVANRSVSGPALAQATVLDPIPEDEQLRELDREGRSLWELPETNPAYQAVCAVAKRLLANQ